MLVLKKDNEIKEKLYISWNKEKSALRAISYPSKLPTFQRESKRFSFPIKKQQTRDDYTKMGGELDRVT